MTIIGALSYGELAAMMPKAGGQYVYLREALGPLWGFLYGWTLFLVIQTGTIAAVGVAFGKFLGVFFPSVSAQNWIWHIGHVPAWHVGPMVLGNMDIGLNTANLAAIVVITLLTLLNTLGVKMGAAVQNVFTSAKVLALAAVVVVGVLAKNAAAIAANFGAGWHNFWAGCRLAYDACGAGGCGWADGVCWAADDGGGGAGGVAVQLGCVEQCDVYGGGDQESEAESAAVVGDWHGGGAAAVCAVQLCLSERAADGGRSGCDDDCGAGDSVCGAGPGGDGGDGAGVCWVWREADGGGDSGLDVWLRERDAAGGARVYYAMSRDGLFFKSVGKLSERSKTPVNSLWVQWAWTCLLCLSGSYGQLLDYVIFAVLIFYILTIVGLFVLAADAAGCGAAL